MINKLFLDLNNFKPNLGSVERGDSIELNIKLLNDEDYSRSKFRLLGAKSDGKSVEQIEGLNLSEKNLKVVLEDQFVNCEGIVKLELNVVSGETEITTKEFYFFVSNTMNGEIVESSDSVPTLEKVSKYVDDAVNNLDALKEASADITIINSEFKENEIKRKANEMLREKNEKARLQSEDIRITGEEERKTNELERIQAENDRKVSESNRKLAENTRKTNEAARVEAELNRQSLFEENEEIRNSNENLRIASEKERIKFNSEAKTDELNRKEAEKNRVLAEEERKSSEESRVAAEAIRQNTYTDFNESEEERKSNEIKRQEAEALRVEAETRRDNLFSEKEEERNTSFIESEKVRNAAFNKAQDSRNTTFEESETIREEAFKISEKARNDAEELRVTAESERVKAEKLRVDSEKARVLAEEERNNTFIQKEEERNNTFTQNETNRNDTFTQSEEERQGVFEEVENARKVAESKRVKTESSRVEAEKLRVSAETGRVEAENLRVTAEEERVAAETKREEGFNAFEGRISANTKELKNARSATTGEKFNSLDERIDCEVDRLNKKIEVSMLQQEDKENHVIENTVDGMTTDMIVKGMTLRSILSVDRNLTTSETYVDYEVPLLSNGKTYTLFLINKDNAFGRISIGITDGTSWFNRFEDSYSEGSLNEGIYTQTINISSATTPIKLRIKKEENPNATGNIKFILVEGNLKSSPMLPYFEDIKSFGQQGDKISISSHNYNFWNFNDIKTQNEPIKMNIEGNNERFTVKTTAYADGFYVKINAKANETYVFSGVVKGNKPVNYRIMSFDFKEIYSGGNFESVGAFKTQYTPQKNMIIVARIWINTDLATCECENFYFGLLNGEGQTRKQDKKDILLQNLGFDEGLRGLNLTVYDELNDTKKMAIKRIEKHTFTGNESISIRGEVKENTMSFAYVVKNNKSNALLCNNFKVLGGWDKDEERIWLDGTNLMFHIQKSKLTTLDANGFRKWLKANPTTIYYELAEPIETPLGESINVKTFGEKTYIGFENSISGTSSFKAPVDTTATITRLNRENRALEEENKNLRQDFESTTLTLTDSDLELVKQNVDMDFRLMEVEFALDIPQAILSSDIKFKNKKGEVKSMARTPYEMMKIVILSGDYDREDYMHKVGKYYERGRMTKEEHDELMSLMTADEVISK